MTHWYASKCSCIHFIFIKLNSMQDHNYIKLTVWTKQIINSSNERQRTNANRSMKSMRFTIKASYRWWILHKQRRRNTTTHVTLSKQRVLHWIALWVFFSLGFSWHTVNGMHECCLNFYSTHKIKRRKLDFFYSWILGISDHMLTSMERTNIIFELFCREWNRP